MIILECYVGHTTDFTRRKHQHKNDCNNEKRKHYECKVYQTIRENGNWNNWTMVAIEKYPCNDANESTTRERYWFERLNFSLNMNIPNRSQLEYYKQYQSDNKEEASMKRIQTFVCEC
jgi:hypothetical protein